MVLLCPRFNVCASGRTGQSRIRSVVQTRKPDHSTAPFDRTQVGAAAKANPAQEPLRRPCSIFSGAAVQSHSKSLARWRLRRGLSDRDYLATGNATGCCSRNSNNVSLGIDNCWPFLDAATAVPPAAPMPAPIAAPFPPPAIPPISAPNPAPPTTFFAVFEPSPFPLMSYVLVRSG